ncbi:MAG: HAD-IIIC family phosphatase [Oscillospiraceae bacterium]|nr:HAD-IIIC family phosphatase [Oscillospiraceae bacterium]
MQELEYPFQAQLLIRKRKMLKKQLLEKGSFIEKKIAVLGGSTTHDIIDILELFLLNQGIRASFYESEYAQYWNDVMFDNPELRRFQPDVIFIHTSNRNIFCWPEASDSKDQVYKKEENLFEHFSQMWKRLESVYHCPIIQNNFEYPFFRIQGNRDAYDYRGRVHFVTKMNLLFADYASEHDGFYINDINYLSADFGLEKWADPSFWYMYKYALSFDAIPSLAFNVSNIIKSIYGKNKKALALDLDNTLWGGIVGDDGPENLEIGQETALGQAYSEFQYYLKELNQYGVLLSIISKNQPENADAGLSLPQMVLKKDDFVSIKANWEPKSVNLSHLAQEISLLPESFVFVDDNPAEREIVRQQYPSSGIPVLKKVEEYISAIDKSGFFEVTTLSGDDLKRTEMYSQNLRREQHKELFADYSEYLKSLDMIAEIHPFDKAVLSRVTQLTNKSNQFNLTTKRYSQEEMEAISLDNRYITIYGSLKDCFGDNGIVAVTIGEIKGEEVDIILWLMSCRVLKRDMEKAMMDMLAHEAVKRKLTKINGFYYPTAKNGMVRSFYGELGYIKEWEDANGNAKWVLDISQGYQNRNTIISINQEE